MSSYEVRLGTGIGSKISYDIQPARKVGASVHFENMVDELVKCADYDPDLAAGITWIDGEAIKKGISFYEMVSQVLHDYRVKQSASEWAKDKSYGNLK